MYLYVYAYTHHVLIYITVCAATYDVDTTLPVSLLQLSALMSILPFQ